VLCIAALLLAYHLGMRYVITYRLTTRAPAVANPEVDRHGNFFWGRRHRCSVRSRQRCRS
jgi:hypothetical protein